LEYVRSLKFEEDPNYEYLRNLFRQCLQYNNFENDNLFDWLLYENEELSSSTITQTEKITSDLVEKKKTKRKHSISNDNIIIKENKRRRLN